MKKRMVAMFLVVVLALSMLSTVASAAKPSVKLTVSSSTVKRGKTITFKYALKSGSYTKKSGYWRAGFGTYMFQGTVLDDYYKLDEVEYYFTGKINYNLKWKFAKTLPKGKYTNLYATYYRNNIYSDNWKVASAKTKTIKVK